MDFRVSHNKLSVKLYSSNSHSNKSPMICHKDCSNKTNLDERTVLTITKPTITSLAIRSEMLSMVVFSLFCPIYYSDVMMNAMASQITSLTVVYSTVYSGAEERKHQSSASLAFVMGIHRWPVKSPHKGPVTRKMFPFDDVIMFYFEVPYIEVQCIRERHMTGT